MKCNAEFGDLVEIRTSKETFSGIYLPSSKSGIFLLKLKNGYNVGFKKKEILNIELKEKRKQNKNIFEVVNSGKKPTIGMVFLGGTISSRLNPGKGGVDFIETPEDLFLYYPEIFEKFNVEIKVPFMKGSEDMDYKDWQKAAKTVYSFLKDKNIEGIIVAQGTDTLHYTSAALSFFLRDVNKPIVLTYSQRSTDRASSDARLNLVCSSLAATSNYAEVMVVGHATSNDDFCYAIPGTKVRKLHTSKRDAFKAINSQPFFKILEDKLEKISNGRLISDSSEPFLDNSFEEKIAIVKFYPGQNPDILDYYVEKGYKGIILEVVGLGHVATSSARLSWTKKLKDVQKKGLIVCAASQTIYGRLNPMVYVTGRELVESGIIYLENMISEIAFVKLGWVLGHKEWAKDKMTVKEKMLENINHELD